MRVIVHFNFSFQNSHVNYFCENVLYVVYSAVYISVFVSAFKLVLC